MKIFATLFLMLCLSVCAQVPSFKSFINQDFTTNSYLVGGLWTTNEALGGISNKYPDLVIIRNKLTTVGQITNLDNAGIGFRFVMADSLGRYYALVSTNSIGPGGSGWTGNPNQFNSENGWTNLVVGVLTTNLGNTNLLETQRLVVDQLADGSPGELKVIGRQNDGHVVNFSAVATGASTDYLGADGNWHAVPAGGGGFLGNPNQFDDANARTNIISGSRQTNNIFRITDDSELVFGPSTFNTNNILIKSNGMIWVNGAGIMITNPSLGVLAVGTNVVNSTNIIQFAKSTNQVMFAMSKNDNTIAMRCTNSVDFVMLFPNDVGISSRNTASAELRGGGASGTAGRKSLLADAVTLGGASATTVQSGSFQSYNSGGNCYIDIGLDTPGAFGSANGYVAVAKAGQFAFGAANNAFAATATGIFDQPGSGNFRLGSNPANGASSVIGTLQWNTTNTTINVDHVVGALEFGLTFNNNGASGTVTNTLPASVLGNQVWGYVATAQNMTWKANAADKFRMGPTVTASGGVIYDNHVGTKIHLVCDIAGTWTVELLGGTITIGP